MADTTARALRLLELLQSAQLRGGAELARRLGVDERTVRRDIERLTDLGVPVETVRGRYGGYRLAAGHRVLPLMFSAEEAVAVFLGLSRSRPGAARPAAERTSQLAAQTALAKVTRALPVDETRRIHALLGTMTPEPAEAGPDDTPAVAPASDAAAPDPAVMLTLADAVAGRRRLDLRYVDGSGRHSRRTVHPLELVPHEDRWYLVALDPAAGAERTFRADRIRTVRPLAGTFEQPAGRERAGAHARLVERFAEAEYRWRVVLRVRAEEGRIRVRLPASVARLEREDAATDVGPAEGPPWFRVEIHAHDLAWLPAVIAGLDAETVVEEPAELRELVATTARRMLRAIGVGPGDQPRAQQRRRSQRGVASA